MRKTIAYFLGTHEDWGGASRALLNFVRSIDQEKFNPLVVLTKEGNLSQTLTREGIDWTLRKKSDRGRNLAVYLLQIIDACRFFREHKIDIIHLNEGAIGWKPPEILAAKLMQVPLVSHIHIVTNEPSSYLKYSSAVVTVSRYVAEHSQTFSVPTHAIYNISYLKRFSNGTDIRSELGYNEHHVIVLFMGQMIRAKGLEPLVAAFRKVPNTEARLLMAGAIRKTDGAYTESEISELISGDSRIRYIGFRTDAENLYRTADLLVMPSQWEEPCAMIIFEAAAAGKPLVATLTGGTPEVLRDGETGFLVERSDIQQLARRIRMLIDDPVLRRSMGEAAKRVADSEYASEPVRRMENLYQSLRP